MIIKFHIENENDGIILLELPPQKRTVRIAKSHKGLHYLEFDYTLFTIAYSKIENKFLYRGLKGSGLRVFSSNKSLSSINDKIDFCPIESERFGLSCTEHSYDNKQFDSLEELVEFVISMWWGLAHTQENSLHPVGFRSNIYPGRSSYTSSNSNQFQKCCDEKQYKQALKNTIVQIQWPSCSDYPAPILPEEVEIINKPWRKK